MSIEELEEEIKKKDLELKKLKLQVYEQSLQKSKYKVGDVLFIGEEGFCCICRVEDDGNGLPLYSLYAIENEKQALIIGDFVGRYFESGLEIFGEKLGTCEYYPNNKIISLNINYKMK